MRHPKDMSRRQFLTRAGGTAIAMPSLAAILAACSKPSTGLRRRVCLGQHPDRDPRRADRAPHGPGPDRGRHADRVRPAGALQLGRLHLQEGGRGVRGQVRRRRPDHDLQQPGRRHPEGRQRSGRRPTCSCRRPGYLRRLVGERPAPAAAARPDPQHGERLAELFQPGSVLRPRTGTTACRTRSTPGALPIGATGSTTPTRHSRAGRRCGTTTTPARSACTTPTATRSRSRSCATGVWT